LLINLTAIKLVYSIDKHTAIVFRVRNNRISMLALVYFKILKLIYFVNFVIVKMF